jgi:transcriptional regulator with XRE-family HTH domain
MAPRPGRTRTVDKTLAALLAIRVEQLAQEHGDLAAFLKKAGISPGTYYILIRGDGNPTLDTIEMIAKGLGISVWELIGLDDMLVKYALSTKSIDLEAIKASNKARAEAFGALDMQRAGGKTEISAD